MSTEPSPEIERKFLVSEPLTVGLGDADLVEQGYLTPVGSMTEVRIRRVENRYTLTIKTGHGLVRSESEWELDPFEATHLWAATAGHRICKFRHRVALGDGFIAEVDRYLEPCAGLITVEVEFADRDAAERFIPPAWFGPEVTGNPDYANRALAGPSQ